MGFLATDPNPNLAISQAPKKPQPGGGPGAGQGSFADFYGTPENAAKSGFSPLQVGTWFADAPESAYVHHQGVVGNAASTGSLDPAVNANAALSGLASAAPDTGMNNEPSAPAPSVPMGGANVGFEDFEQHLGPEPPAASRTARGAQLGTGLGQGSSHAMGQLRKIRY